MPRSIVLAVLAAITALIALSSPTRDSNAAFHIMRIWGAMAGASSQTSIQYVELRMPDSGQNFVANQHLCFYDAAGTPIARFRFPANVPGGATGASILVGTEEFDAAWAVGSPDFTFEGNTVSLPSGTPIGTGTATAILASPAGMVRFGTDSTTTPASMCLASFSEIDSVAYGTAFSGTNSSTTRGTPYPPALNADLTASSASIAKLVRELCHPASFQGHQCPGHPTEYRNNDLDYDIVDANAAGNNPRNNSNQSGPVSPPPPPDADGDGVPDGSDLCPGTPPATAVDANGCSDAQVDADGDSVCDPGAPSNGPSGCTGSDNCPRWANPTQALPPWTVPAGDPDCDGFPSTANTGPPLNRGNEAFIGTMADVQCAANSGANNEPLPDRWPMDFNDDQRANTLDVTGNYIGNLNKPLGDPAYAARRDLNSNNAVNTLDVLLFVPFLNKMCTP